MYNADTIAAVATPLGCGGIGIVRVSGPLSELIGLKIFRGVIGGGFNSHRLYYGHFHNPVDGAILDEGMAVLMRGPRSYTREDVLELHSHGGYLVVRSVLQACVSAGARLAEPGEFTLRAFLNGRIDLCQAEAVIDIINSRTDASLALAQRQRQGQLGRELEVIRLLTAESLAIIEAYIDFPEDDIDSTAFSLVIERLETARRMISRLIATFQSGKLLREGVSVLLAGKPNVGKSSLLNALACEERAIVSSVPGTTRDVVEEIVAIQGMPVRIIDAAGIRRHHSDEIEREGIRRALSKLAEADLILYLVDGSLPLDADDHEIVLAIAGRPFIAVLTKSDIPRQAVIDSLPDCRDVIELSSRTGYGLDRLRSSIFDFFLRDAPHVTDDFATISNVRHRDVLLRASNGLDMFDQHVASGASPDLLSIDLRDVLSSLGEITGVTTPDSILDLIFSTFCIGK